MTDGSGWTAPTTPSRAVALEPGEADAPATPDEQLEMLRKLAVDWRTGQLGILGLASIVTAFKGSTNIEQLSRPEAVLAGGSILLSLVTAGAAVFLLSSVAWGWPRLRATPIDRSGSAERRLRASLLRMKWGVGLTFVSLAFTGSALAISWYAPVTRSGLVRVEGPAGDLCGTFVMANATGVIIDARGQHVALPLSQIISVAPVGTCP